MNTDLQARLLRCEDAYTRCFAEIYEDDQVIRFQDALLPDMYDHHYAILKRPQAAPGLPAQVEAEIAFSRAQGRDFCQVRYLALLDASLPQGFSLEAEPSRYLLCYSEAPAALCLDGAPALQVRRAVDSAGILDRLAVERDAYLDTRGEDFLSRKALRSGLVYLSDAPLDTYIAYVDGCPVGKGDLFLHEGVAMIEDLDVSPAHQRKGYGTALLRHMVQAALAAGADTLLLVADADDTAKDLYLRLGCQALPGRTQLFFLLI